MTKFTNVYIEQLTTIISKLNPYLIVLFGSYAYGKPHKDSDIDLLVVTNDEFVPNDYDDQINLQLSVRNHIIDISKKIPIDLLVYTLPMYKKFIEMNSSFARQLTQNGVILYEGHHTTMA